MSHKVIEVDPQMTQILKLADKYLKITINDMFKTIEGKIDKIDEGIVNFSPIYYEEPNGYSGTSSIIFEIRT